MGWEWRTHLRESSLWDSALLSSKEIKKTAERTPATFREDQLLDPFCAASVRAAELLFYTSICGFMLFPLQPHGCNDAFTVALLESMSLRGAISATKWREAPTALGGAGICPPLSKNEEFIKPTPFP